MLCIFTFLLITISITAYIVFMIKNSQAEAEQKRKQDEENARLERERKEQERKEHIAERKKEFAEQFEAIPNADPLPVATEQTGIDYKITKITRATPLTKLCDCVIVDLETTGLSASKCEIIEIGAVKIENFEVTEKFDIFVKPSKALPDKIVELTGITDAMLSDATDITTAIDKLQAFVSNSTIVAHNAEFDMDFLQANNFVFAKNQRVYDTLQLSQSVLKKYNDSLTNGDVIDHKLETLCNYYDIYRDDAHRATSDCYATALVYKNLINDLIGID